MSPPLKEAPGLAGLGWSGEEMGSDERGAGHSTLGLKDVRSQPSGCFV